MGRLEASGEEGGEEAAKGGHAGAEEADVAGEDGPVGGGDVVPGWVCAVAEGGEGLEAEGGDHGAAGDEG